MLQTEQIVTAVPGAWTIVQLVEKLLKKVLKVS